jgi:aspartate/methionine/tyrosine aminotransferase
MHASKRVQSIEPSPIRRIIDLAESRPDIIGLHAGEPDFPTPSHIVEAASRALQEGHTHYTHGAGVLELREAISRKLLDENEIDANPKTEITVTAGGFAAAFAITQSMIDPGDEVIVLEPSWPSYAGFVRLAGGVPVPVPLRGPAFEPNVSELRAHFTNRTKMIIVNSPNNPTGSVYSKSSLLDLAKLAKEKESLVLSDEVYEKIVFDGNEHFSAASRSDLRDSIITVNSFSKTYAMTGWRIGYVVASESVSTQIRKIHGYMVSCAPSSAQEAAIEALSGPQDCVTEMVDEYHRRRGLIVAGLNDVDGFHCVAPKGTFYAFPDISGTGIPSTKLAEELLEKVGVASIPGSAFGKAGEGYLRVSFAASQASIQQGLARIRDWRQKRS